MDKRSYEKRKEDEQRRFVRFTLPGGKFIYVDRYTVTAFGTNVEEQPFIRVDGINNVVTEGVREIMDALGMRDPT